MYGEVSCLLCVSVHSFRVQRLMATWPTYILLLGPAEDTSGHFAWYAMISEVSAENSGLPVQRRANSSALLGTLFSKPGRIRRSELVTEVRKSAVVCLGRVAKPISQK